MSARAFPHDCSPFTTCERAFYDRCLASTDDCLGIAQLSFASCAAARCGQGLVSWRCAAGPLPSTCWKRRASLQELHFQRAGRQHLLGKEPGTWARGCRSRPREMQLQDALRDCSQPSAAAGGSKTGVGMHARQ